MSLQINNPSESFKLKLNNELFNNIFLKKFINNKNKLSLNNSI